MANRAFNKTGRYTNLYSETATTRADGELGSLDNDAQSPHARWKYFFAYSCVALAIALLAAWGLSRWFAFDFLVAFAVVALASIPICFDLTDMRNINSPRVAPPNIALNRTALHAS